jgi:hypothetical protein
MAAMVRRNRRLAACVLASTTALVATLVGTAEPPPEAAVVPLSPAATATAPLDGYWMADRRGHVHAFGTARHLGEGPFGTVGIAAAPGGAGYWLVTERGDVVPRGRVPELGGRPVMAAGERVVGLSPVPTGSGAWLMTSGGRVHPRGGAPSFGDAGGLPLNGPMISGVATPSGRGYWLVARDGGVFSFGDARFHGSMGGRPLNGAVIGLVPTPTGGGYWLVAADGGIFSFGDARFHGSMGGRPLNRPIAGMVAAGGGYLMVAADGGVFAFGPGVRFHGSLGAAPPADPVVSLTPVPAGVTPLGLDASPRFRSWVEPVDRARLPHSWRNGCPVGPDQLRLVTVDHRDVFGLQRTGELVVHRDVADQVVRAMASIHAARFPIVRMELVDRYGGDDDRSMEANNTSAFNCRRTTGGTAWSEHSYGRAIDINPVENPYVRGTTVLPLAGRDHLDRTRSTPGLIREGDAVVRAFDAIGWGWGGRWTTSKDYQHFSSTGR